MDIYHLCGISRQAHLQAIQRSLKESEKEVLFVRIMEQVREIHPGMGLRTMYDMVQPDGIGRDPFIILGLREGFRLKTIEKYTRTTYSVKSNRYQNLLAGKEFNGINQLWSSDITYYFLADQFYYIVLIMDVYSRRIVGYNLADNMRAENNLTALKRALEFRAINKYNYTLIHHSDKGTQYASDKYTELIDSYEIQISMCREVYENTHIERLNDTIKNQYLNRWNIQSIIELKQKLAETIHTYNHTRPHQSLNKLSPVQYEEKLEAIPLKTRIKMIIYTTSSVDTIPKMKQLDLFENL
jgi:putative transposase